MEAISKCFFQYFQPQLDFAKWAFAQLQRSKRIITSTAIGISREFLTVPYLSISIWTSGVPMSCILPVAKQCFHSCRLRKQYKNVILNMTPHPKANRPPVVSFACFSRHDSPNGQPRLVVAIRREWNWLLLSPVCEEVLEHFLCT